MKLDHIKTSKCPECGCTVIVLEEIEAHDNKIRKHTNGGQWETRKFLCGKEINWIPNFLKEEFCGQCKMSEDYKHEQERIKYWQQEMDKLQRSIPKGIKSKIQYRHLFE